MTNIEEVHRSARALIDTPPNEDAVDLYDAAATLLLHHARAIFTDLYPDGVVDPPLMSLEEARMTLGQF